MHLEHRGGVGAKWAVLGGMVVPFVTPLALWYEDGFCHLNILIYLKTADADSICYCFVCLTCCLKGDEYPIREIRILGQYN